MYTNQGYKRKRCMFCHSLLLLKPIYNISVFFFKREVVPVIICRIHKKKLPLPLMLVAQKLPSIFQSCKLYSTVSRIAGTCEVHVLVTRAHKNIHKPKIQHLSFTATGKQVYRPTDCCLNKSNENKNRNCQMPIRKFKPPGIRRRVAS